MRQKAAFSLQVELYVLKIVHMSMRLSLDQSHAIQLCYDLLLCICIPQMLFF